MPRPTLHLFVDNASLLHLQRKVITNHAQSLERGPRYVNASFCGAITNVASFQGRGLNTLNSGGPGNADFELGNGVSTEFAVYKTSLDFFQKPRAPLSTRHACFALTPKEKGKQTTVVRP